MSNRSENLSTRLEAEDHVVRMFVATDERDWTTLEACFTEPFILDMTSMVGGEPAHLTPRQVAEAWAKGFEPLSSVHHQVGNFRTTLIARDETSVRCYGVALHHRDDVAPESGTRRFVGTYEIDLHRQGEEWRISRLKFLLKFIDGNVHLETAN